MKDSDGIGARHLLAKLKEAEYPTLSKKKKDGLSDEKKRELQCFFTNFLTAEDWSDDKVDDTLKNL